ncbi:MAG TPA: Smr/MutS family protein [Pseudomonadaceae bacterium]|nr:Smr/MutS family protein [Pseudomonadaceae bacterium]
MMRECLHCGMPAQVPRLQLEDLPPSRICLKCDSDLYSQSDASVLTRDIAHQQESVKQALAKLENCLIAAWEGHARSLRLVVGGGLIRQDVLGQLEYLQNLGVVLEYSEDRPNRGAILVRIRA